MGVAENAFELERRQITWSPLTTLNDTVTSLLYDGDPNQVDGTASGTDGEQWLYSLPAGQLYKQSDATLWWKSGTPNTWVQVIQGSGGGGGAQNFTVVTVNGSTASTTDPQGTHDYVYAVQTADYYMSLDATFLGANEKLALDLPQASGDAGRTLVVKEAKPSTNSGTVVTIRAHSGELVEGVATMQLNLYERASVTLYSDGTNYYVV